jgi:hypothetical protein
MAARHHSSALMVAGLLIWAVHFGIVYGFTGLVCARPAWAQLTIAGWGLIPFGVTLATAAAAAALIAVLVWSKNLGMGAPAGEIPAARLQRFVAIGGALIALVAIAWEVFPALMIGACR